MRSRQRRFADMKPSSRRSSTVARMSMPGEENMAMRSRQRRAEDMKPSSRYSSSVVRMSICRDGAMEVRFRRPCIKSTQSSPNSCLITVQRITCQRLRLLAIQRFLGIHFFEPHSSVSYFHSLKPAVPDTMLDTFTHCSSPPALSHRPYISLSTVEVDTRPAISP
jgi:hypothetical protein